MTDPLVTMRHVRRAKLCAAGVRTFMARYGLDYGRFLREGLPASELEATQDALVSRPVELAREEASRGR